MIYDPATPFIQTPYHLKYHPVLLDWERNLASSIQLHELQGDRLLFIMIAT